MKWHLLAVSQILSLDRLAKLLSNSSTPLKDKTEVRATRKKAEAKITISREVVKRSNIYARANSILFCGGYNRLAGAKQIII